MKSARLYSVLKAKCPVCLEGDVFDNKGVYDLKNIDKMHVNCSNCGHKYEKEAGFWYGAMYVSYGLTVIMSVAIFTITYLLFPKASVWLYIGVIVFIILLLGPITFRSSRLVWMNLFARYNPLKAKTHE